MRNDIRMAVKSIARNTESLETALVAAEQYESAMNIGGQKQGGAQRYGQVNALEITGSSDAAASASSSNGPAGMQEMKKELAAITSALAAIGVQKKGGKPKPPGGVPPRGPRKQPTGSTAGGAGTGRSTSDALGIGRINQVNTWKTLTIGDLYIIPKCMQYRLLMILLVH
jgi:hypothetical protein